MKLDFQPGVIASKLDDRNSVRFCKPILKFHTVLQFFKLRRVVFELSAYLGMIDTGHFCRWMREAISELPIICQEQKSLGIPVEPAHRKKPRHIFGQKIDHRRAMLGIIKRRDAFSGLVKQHIIALF